MNTRVLFWGGSLAGGGAILAVSMFWIMNFHGAQVSPDSKEWAEFGGFFGGVLAPVLAYASLLGLLLNLTQEQRKSSDQVKRQDSHVNLEYGVSCLSRAYEVLTCADDGMGIKKDRLAWLTAARLLIAAKSSREQISTSSIAKMYDGEEEYWRRRFYDLLQPMNLEGFGASADNFEAGGLTPAEGIEERSIRVIYGFTDWPEGVGDPIDEIDLFSEAEIANMRLGKRGVGEFIRAKRRMYERQDDGE